MTTNPTSAERSVESVAAGLTSELRDALAYEERTHLEACQLNALGLVHMDVVKDSEGRLVDLRATLTPFGLKVHAHLTASEKKG